MQAAIRSVGIRLGNVRCAAAIPARFMSDGSFKAMIMYATFITMGGGRVQCSFLEKQNIIYTLLYTCCGRWTFNGAVVNSGGNILHTAVQVYHSM